jgi:hypothetical protein
MPDTNFFSHDMIWRIVLTVALMISCGLLIYLRKYIK